MIKTKLMEEVKLKEDHLSLNILIQMNKMLCKIIKKKKIIMNNKLNSKILKSKIKVIKIILQILCQKEGIDDQVKKLIKKKLNFTILNSKIKVIK